MEKYMQNIFKPKLIERAAKSGFDVSNRAVYLPAVNAQFAKAPLVPDDPNRPVPTDFKNADLNFWDGNSSLFDYPFILHSAGQFSPLTEVDNAVTRGSNDTRFMLGDSAGFQIGSGTFNIPALKVAKEYLAAVDAWECATNEKEWIVHWLERNSSYAMTIDMPLWAKTTNGEKSPFRDCTIEELTEMTVDNLAMINDLQTGHCKWLNVIQGLDANTTAKWIAAVSPYKFGGWALAGGAGCRGGVEQVARTILTMRDQNLFDAGMDLLHMLGVSTPIWAVIFTRIQQHLRKQNSNLCMTFDSSSPFLMAGRYEQSVAIRGMTTDISSWSFDSEEAPNAAPYVGSSAPFPYDNPFADGLTLGHLNVRADEFEASRYDSMSLQLIAYCNVWAYLTAFNKANQLAEKSLNNLPPLYKQCIEAIDEAFTTSNWTKVLEENKKVFDRVKSNEYVDAKGCIKFISSL
jgi:hypothetical protein